MPTPSVRFFHDTVTNTNKVLFEETITSTKVAMAQDCCCDGGISLPGYGIYARSCCSGEIIEPKVYIDLTRPPDYVFTDTFKASANMGTPGNCFFFFTGDVTPGVAFLLPDVDGSATILVPGSADWVRISGGCDNAECGCKCCNDFQDDSEDPDAGTRAEFDDYSPGPDPQGGGYYWYMFEGITICSDVFDPYLTALSDPVTFGPIWQKTRHFDPPTGPYTSAYSGNQWHDNDCPVTLRPEISVTTDYFLNAACTIPSNRPSVFDQLTVRPDNVSVTTRGDRTNKVFLITAYSAPNFDCFNPLTIANEAVCGVDLASGGTVTIYPCCPTESGGI